MMHPTVARTFVFSSMLGALALSFLLHPAFAQGFNDQANRAVNEPFVGITEDGTAERGLFKIEGTGVSTADIAEAARALLASLDSARRQKISFAVDSTEWRHWANVHRFQREGVSLAEMTAEQRERAYALLRTSLSARGYKTAEDIMRLNQHLGELVNNPAEYNEHLYWFSILGEPSPTAPWGWQIDGHHLIINYFVLGDQVVMTPTFMGSEPVKALSGKYAGTSILEPEQDRGLSLMQSLPADQQRAAMIGQKQGRSSNQTEMLKDNVRLRYQGLRANRMSSAHRDQLLSLIELYVGNMKDGHAKVKMGDARRHIDRTHFAWIGGTDNDAVFYYRIHSPVILIEFDHQGPIALSGPGNVPTRRHIHTVVRTPNGNDYGKDLLRQHYEAHKHDRAHGHTNEAPVKRAK